MENTKTTPDYQHWMECMNDKSETEKPIAACEAIFTAFRKTRIKDPDTKELEDKIVVQFMLHPNDVQTQLMELPLGSIVKLYIMQEVEQ